MQWKSLGPALGALVLVTVACNLGNELPSVTTVATTTTTAPLTAEQAATEFHSCLTDQGLVLPAFPTDDNGRPDLSALTEAVDQNSAEWRDALAACATVIVSNGALDLSADPELAEAVTTRLMVFSTCMRSQGVEAFPDPPADFDGTTPPYPLTAIPASDPEFTTAAEACALTVGAGPSG